MGDSQNARSHTGWTTSLGLLNGIRANDSVAWERFTHLYGALFDHWFRLAGVAEGEWADLRQDIFLAVSRGLEGYEHRPARGSFRGWLRIIVRNKLTDHARKRFPPPMANATIDRGVSPPELEESPTEQSLLLRRALDLIRTDFEPSSWRAFWLLVVEDRTPADVAAELVLTLNAVYLAKARVLRRLREEFADFLDDAPPSTG